MVASADHRGEEGRKELLSKSLEPLTTHRKMMNIIPPKKSNLSPVISSPTSVAFPICTWGGAA